MVEGPSGRAKTGRGFLRQGRKWLWISSAMLKVVGGPTGKAEVVGGTPEVVGAPLEVVEGLPVVPEVFGGPSGRAGCVWGPSGRVEVVGGPSARP